MYEIVKGRTPSRVSTACAVDFSDGVITACRGCDTLLDIAVLCS
nr:MAG TPA: hypothetical protein [Caudoviricetes sp.]